MPSDQELVTFSEHVLYEMSMLVSLPQRFLTADINDVVLKNALLESFAIHARQLLKFLYDNADHGEIVSSDYFDNPRDDWKKVRPKEDARIQQLEKRVGEEVAHLTLARNKTNKNWDLFTIVREISGRCDLFLSLALPSRISKTDHDEFLRRLQEHKSFVAGWQPAHQMMGATGPVGPTNTVSRTLT